MLHQIIFKSKSTTFGYISVNLYQTGNIVEIDVLGKVVVHELEVKNQSNLSSKGGFCLLDQVNFAHVKKFQPHPEH